MYATLLADIRFHDLLLACDQDLADTCRAEGCELCGGRLHLARAAGMSAKKRKDIAKKAAATRWGKYIK